MMEAIGRAIDCNVGSFEDVEELGQIYSDGKLDDSAVDAEEDIEVLTHLFQHLHTRSDGFSWTVRDGVARRLA